MKLLWNNIVAPLFWQVNNFKTPVHAGDGGCTSQFGVFTFHFTNEVSPMHVSYCGNILKQFRIVMIGRRNVGPANVGPGSDWHGTHCTAVRALDEIKRRVADSALAVVMHDQNKSGMGSVGTEWQFNQAAGFKDPPSDRFRPAIIRPKGGPEPVLPPWIRYWEPKIMFFQQLHVKSTRRIPPLLLASEY